MPRPVRPHRGMSGYRRYRLDADLYVVSLVVAVAVVRDMASIGCVRSHGLRGTLLQDRPRRPAELAGPTASTCETGRSTFLGAIGHQLSSDRPFMATHK
jgi:hypothetical protein